MGKSISKEEVEECKDILNKLLFLAKELNCTIDIAATILIVLNNKPK